MVKPDLMPLLYVKHGITFREKFSLVVRNSSDLPIACRDNLASVAGPAPTLPPPTPGLANDVLAAAEGIATPRRSQSTRKVTLPVTDSAGTPTPNHFLYLYILLHTP
ncbi:hypothetical protein J6590_015331 [Homalodisca vitripennis]|nr:hypothetical protein J6590_015331 [Homalodisca vitripennis]